MEIQSLLSFSVNGLKIFGVITLFPAIPEIKIQDNCPIIRQLNYAFYCINSR